ncbi:hypothetical protein Tco_0453386 [Tanacetum coccineum]
MEKSLASHISSKGRSQSGAIKIGASWEGSYDGSSLRNAFKKKEFPSGLKKSDQIPDDSWINLQERESIDFLEKKISFPSVNLVLGVELGQPEVGTCLFGTSIISRRHRVLCHLGFTFHYFRRRRSSRNRGSLISNTASGGNTLQIFLRVSNGITRECPELKVEEVFGVLGFTNWCFESHPSTHLVFAEPELGKVELGEPGVD